MQILGNNAGAVLHVYSAADVAHELFNSNMHSGPDALGTGISFLIPTVANGKVYVGPNNELSVFGLFP